MEMTTPASEEIARLTLARDEIIVEIRELQGHLARKARDLAAMDDEIASLRRVQEELVRRHPEIGSG
jgi:chromosome segregation ATPase